MWYVDMVLQWVPLFAFGFNFHRNSMCTSLSHTTRNFNWSSTIDHTDTKLSVITIHNHISISCFLSIYYYLIKVQIKWLIEHNETEQIKHTVIQHNHLIDRFFVRWRIYPKKSALYCVDEDNQHQFNESVKT